MNNLQSSLSQASAASPAGASASLAQERCRTLSVSTWDTGIVVYVSGEGKSSKVYHPTKASLNRVLLFACQNQRQAVTHSLFVNDGGGLCAYYVFLGDVR